MIVADIYCMVNVLGPVLSVLQVLTHLISRTLGDRYYYHSYFTDGQGEAQKV